MLLNQNVGKLFNILFWPWVLIFAVSTVVLQGSGQFDLHICCFDCCFTGVWLIQSSCLLFRLLLYIVFVSLVFAFAVSTIVLHVSWALYSYYRITIILDDISNNNNCNEHNMNIDTTIEHGPRLIQAVAGSGVVLGASGRFWVVLGWFWMVLGGSGVVLGGSGMVLGGYGVVLGGSGWFWLLLGVVLGWFWSGSGWFWVVLG